MNTAAATATEQFLFVSDAAKALGVSGPALRKAARGWDLRAEYELADWTRLAQARGLI